jgi:hypothetical protein
MTSQAKANGAGFAGTVLGLEGRRAGYGTAPPASRVAARSLTRRPSAALGPGASTAPRQAHTTGRPNRPARPQRAAPRRPHAPRPTKITSLRFQGIATDRLGIKPRNMLTQLAEWTRLGFLTRANGGTYQLATRRDAASP